MWSWAASFSVEMIMKDICSDIGLRMGMVRECGLRYIRCQVSRHNRIFQCVAGWFGSVLCFSALAFTQLSG